MKKIILAWIMIVFLSACALSQTTATEIPTAVPTPTYIPFASFDLENQLVTEGDLPPGFSGSQIRYTPNDFTEKAPPADYVINQVFSHNNAMGGMVTVLLYEDIGKVTIAYQSFLDTMIMSNAEDAGIGEKSTSSSNVMFINTTDLAFIRCHAAVHIQFMGSISKDDVIAYGQRLDKRLQSLVCRP